MSLQGIDISQWQGVTPPLDGLAFVIARATYGSARDTGYAIHARNVRAAGLALGAYCFGRNADGATQARALLAAAPDADFYALDLESDGANPTMTAAQAQAFMAEMHRLGHRAGLYHSKSGFPNVGQDWNWVAAWDGIDPGAGWTFHQYRGAPLDLDVFAGDAQALASFLAAQEVPAVAQQPAALTPSAEPVAYAGLITSLILAGIQYATGTGLLTADQAGKLTPQAAVIANGLIALLPFLISLVTRQAVTPNGNVPQPSAATTGAAPAPAPSVTPPSVTPESHITVLDSQPINAQGNIGARTPRYSVVDGSLITTGGPDGDGYVGPAILRFVSKDNLSGSRNGHFYKTGTEPPYYVSMHLVPDGLTDLGTPPVTLIDRTTRPSIFASGPVAAAGVGVSFGSFDRAGAISRFGDGTPQASALGGDQPYMIAGDGGNLVTFSRTTAWQWWVAYGAAPFDLRLVAPGAMPGSLVLNADQLAIAQSVSKQVLPPPPSSFPFPLPLNPNLTTDSSTLAGIITQIEAGNPNYPRFDPRVSFTAKGIVVAA